VALLFIAFCRESVELASRGGARAGLRWGWALRSLSSMVLAPSCCPPQRHLWLPTPFLLIHVSGGEQEAGLLLRSKAMVVGVAGTEESPEVRWRCCLPPGGLRVCHALILVCFHLFEQPQWQNSCNLGKVDP
jgi:hypothetical protein